MLGGLLTQLVLDLFFELLLKRVYLNLQLLSSVEKSHLGRGLSISMNLEFDVVLKRVRLSVGGESNLVISKEHLCHQVADSVVFAVDGEAPCVQSLRVRKVLNLRLASRNLKVFFDLRGVHLSELILNTAETNKLSMEISFPELCLTSTVSQDTFSDFIGIGSSTLSDEGSFTQDQSITVYQRTDFNLPILLDTIAVSEPVTQLEFFLEPRRQD